MINIKFLFKFRIVVYLGGNYFLKRLGIFLFLLGYDFSL